MLPHRGTVYVLRNVILALCLSGVGEAFTPPPQQGNVAATNPSNATDSLLLVASTERGLSFAQSSSRVQMQAASNSDDSSSQKNNNKTPDNHNGFPPPAAIVVLQRVRNALGLPLRVVGRLLRPNSAQASVTTMEAPNGLDPSAAAAAAATVNPTAIDTKMEPIPGRTATATVDLSGVWELVVTEEFKQEYDQYLLRLGQPFLVRSIAVNVITLTQEETQQSDKGRTLFIRGSNVKGVWERTLTASGPLNGKSSDFEPIHTTITTADDEQVLAEAWWEDNGTVHRSWLRGVEKYGGGSFESRRYLQDNGQVLVCESTFHPNDEKRKKASVTWKFQRLPASNN